MARAALAHLVPSGPGGAELFAKLERFRADKARFWRRVEPGSQREGAGTDGGSDLFGAAFPERHCPDPRCGRLLRAVAVAPAKPLAKPLAKPPNSGAAVAPGVAPPMLVCGPCGATTCAACGGDEGHLGLSCGEQQRHAAAAAELAKEAASLKWLAEHTKVREEERSASLQYGR
jgi:hypothetical protein